jgi:hypothetical protein
MADPVEPVQAVAGAVRMDNLRHIKLLDIWPQAPQLWFSQTECRFAAHGVADEFARYCLAVGVLPHNSLWRVADIMESPPQENPYTIIKQPLLGVHLMTDYQRAEKLYLSPAIGNRKPSEMMAAMLEMCPRGEEKTNLFACLFLQRLPREIKVLLSCVDHKDPKLLSEEADALWSLHGSRRRLPLFRVRWTSRSTRRSPQWRHCASVGVPAPGSGAGAATVDKAVTPAVVAGRRSRRLRERPAWLRGMLEALAVR